MGIATFSIIQSGKPWYLNEKNKFKENIHGRLLREDLEIPLERMLTHTVFADEPIRLWNGLPPKLISLRSQNSFRQHFHASTVYARAKQCVPMYNFNFFFPTIFHFFCFNSFFAIFIFVYVLYFIFFFFFFNSVSFKVIFFMYYVKFYDAQ